MILYKRPRHCIVRNAILELAREGHSMGSIARQLGITKGKVAGVIWREKRKAEAKETWQQTTQAPPYSTGQR